VMHLSGGERRRVLLARVMATRAGWWLLDEPLSSLDLKVQGVVMDVVRAHCDAGGGAVIVCHDINWVMARCQRVLLCHEGVLWADGPPGDVLTHEAIREVFGVEVTGVGEGERRRWIHQV
jgi:iron complex transport system ATP-binding protein